MPTRLFTLAVLLLVAVWAAWPYGRLYTFGQAVDAEEVTRIEAAVDWQSVRGHLKTDVRRALSEELASGSDAEPGEALARAALMLLGSAVVESLVESYATPEALLAVLREIAEAGDGEGTFRDLVSYAFFAAPTRFRVEVKPEGSEGEPLALIFTFQNFGWVLTRLVLPLDELKGNMSHEQPLPEERE